MSAYLTNSSCNGYPPQHLAARRRYPRPGLTARLLRERQVARFVVAPGGFGKSFVALEYAGTVFGYEHVFWLDGRSPCFLRDLDRGTIAPTLLAADAARFLVVLEDVPPLDLHRVELLSRTFDDLLERGCEVLATCTPTCDAFAGLQQDRLKLSAADLLLCDAEIDSVRTSDERTSAPASGLSPAQRVAGLRWGPAGGVRPFVASLLQEELPADLLLAVTAALVLQDGGVSDLAAFGPCAESAVRHLAENYPYLGIDLRSERFEAVRVPVIDVAAVLSDRLEALALCSYAPDRDALVSRLADALVARSSAPRACELMAALGSRPARAAWLSARGHDLLGASCLLPAVELYESLGGEPGAQEPALAAAEAVRVLALSDAAAACALARRPLDDEDAGDEVRALAALVLFCGASGSARARARFRLSQLVQEREGADDGEFLRAVSRAADGGTTWRPLAAMACAHARSGPVAAAAWRACRDAGADCGALLVGAAWMLERAVVAAAQPGAALHAGASACELAEVAAFVRACCEAPRPAPCGLFGMLAASALERACACGALEAAPPDAKALFAFHRIEMEVHSQRASYERVARGRSVRRKGAGAEACAAFRADAGAVPAAQAVQPTLTVNLFGGIDVRIGDEPVEPRFFRRQKVKTLLALLVINRGREFSRDALVRLLWPDSNLESARKNFYSVWSLLRRALVTPAGTCPYLIRQQNGLRLDGRLLVSDVAQLESVCRTLQLEHPDYGGWASLLAQINDRFSDDLLPSETENDYIVRRRIDYRNRFVDALVAASRRLVKAGGVQEGLWFARAALMRDRTREDAYTTLMGAQLAVGQRTAALETYFQCRRFLADELGIDPSLETMALYRSIIETETALE